MQLFDECKDGLILCKLTNNFIPDITDTLTQRMAEHTDCLQMGSITLKSEKKRYIRNKPSAHKPLNAFQVTEQQYCHTFSQGYQLFHMGSSDIPISEDPKHLILGLIW